MEAFQKTAQEEKGHSVPQAPLMLYILKAQPPGIFCCTLLTFSWMENKDFMINAIVYESGTLEALYKYSQLLLY